MTLSSVRVRGLECRIPAANYVNNNKQMKGYHAMLIQLLTWKTSTHASGIPWEKSYVLKAEFDTLLSAVTKDTLITLFMTVPHLVKHLSSIFKICIYTWFWDHSVKHTTVVKVKFPTVFNWCTLSNMYQEMGRTYKSTILVLHVTGN